MRYLLDTNIVSELTAVKPHGALIQWIDEQPDEALFLSAITVGELARGIERLAPSKRREALCAWLHADLLVRFDQRVLAITAETMMIWGGLYTALQTQGRTLSMMDSLIAASALEYGCILATRNTRDFAGAGVPLFNPWTDI